MTQGAKMDLNTKSLPKQKTIKSLIYKTEGFQITINENPPRRKHLGRLMSNTLQGVLNVFLAQLVAR